MNPQAPATALPPPSLHPLGSPHDQAPQIDKASARLLIVDDDPGVIASAERLLGTQGYHCLTAGSGDECLDILRRQSIDVLLLDLHMPGTDGFSVLDQLASIPVHTETIILSGHASFENASQVFQKGACDFLPKPHSPQQLYNAIDRAIDKLNLRHRLQHMSNQLEQSEQRYHFIAANSPDMIYLLDSEGRFVYVNEKSHELLGFPPDELVGRHFSGLLEHPADSPPYYAFRERRTGDRASKNIELALKRKESATARRRFEPDLVTIELNAMGMYRKASNDPQFLGTYGVCRDVSERRKAEETIRFLAYHDRLTHLPNRELFLDRLKLSIAQAERNRSKLAVLFLDMDGFKYINDTLGHVVGDNLLQHVAVRLQSLLRDSDTVSRIGGDEFNVLVPNINGQAEARLVAGKILEAFSEPLRVDKHDITVGFSIGISMYPDDARSTTELIKNSDMAMYHIKTRGKRGFEFFSENMQSIYQHRRRLEDEMRQALDQGQFECHFQAQYRIPGNTFFGLESLIRWNHPERGMIPPAQFIPLAEEIGLISEIGQYMLHAACSQLRTWIDQGFEPIKVSVNVSAAQLLDREFGHYVHAIADQYDLPRDCIALEITETVLMQDMDAVIDTLHMIAARGIDISIDDFGVGYSSLAYLQSLPVHILKIDRSFLEAASAEHDRPCLLKGIVALARELDLTVIMEGVETREHLDYVRNAGCDIVQGFYLGHPVPAAEIERELRQNAD